MRTHYRVMDSRSGELYGVFYGDEGYASLDLVTLGALLGEKIGSPLIGIVKLDWSNFDEIEVHVEKLDDSDEQAEEHTRPAISQEPEQTTDQTTDQTQADQVYPWEAEAPIEEDLQEEAGLVTGTKAPRYMIYDRRTIQPMSEYFPEGRFPSGWAMPERSSR